MENEFKKGDIVVFSDKFSSDYGAEFVIISDKRDSSGDFVGTLLNDIGSWEPFSEINGYYWGDEVYFLDCIDFPKDKEKHKYSFTINEYVYKLKYKSIPDTKLARKLYKNIYKEEGGKLWVKA